MIHKIVHVEVSLIDHPRISMVQMMDMIEKLKKKYPHREIYQSGCEYAIVSAEHVNQMTFDDYGEVF
jgi:hypothetical protein